MDKFRRILTVSSAASPVGLALVLVTLFLLALTPGISMTEDLGRHLLLGRIIATEHSIPAANLLTYTCPDFPFINHHWLSEVVFYLTHRLIGLNGLIIFKALLLTSSLAIALFTERIQRSAPLYLFTGILCAVTIAYRAHVRPELFTYLGIALYGLGLTRMAAGKRNGWWLLLILYGFFWANAHIYFIFGIGMVGAYLLSYWIFHLIDRRSEQYVLPIRETILFLLLCLVSCLNPNGWRGLLYPLTIFNNYGIGITENISPIGLWKTVLNPMLLALPILTGIMLYAMIVMMVRWRNLTPIMLTRLIISTTALIATWCMARSAPLLALTLPPLLACTLFPVSQELDPPGNNGGRSSRDAAIFPARAPGLQREASPRAATLSCIVILLNLLLILSILNGAYTRIFPSPIGPTPFGLDTEERYLALRRLQEQGLRGPIFNDYNIGSLVEYNLYPEPAYTDNRPEAFPVSFWQDEYLPALNDIKRWQQMLTERDIQTIIVSLTGVKEAFVRMMMYDTDWQLIHLDFLYGVWVRKSPENQAILANATYTYDDLNAYRDTIAERIRTLDAQPFWKQQVIADQIVYELYSLICIDQQALAWPLVLQMHLRYPDYQIIHELMQVCAPPDAHPALFDVQRRAARFPLSAKQVLDYAAACRQRGLNDEAEHALRRGRIFFPFSK
jgi:hypothetical protein